MQRNIVSSLLISASLLLCPGCWDYREIEQSSVPAAVGVELEDNLQIAFTTQLVRPLSPGEADSSTAQPALITARSYAVALAARRSMLSLSQVPEWSHVKTMILGEKLVNHDLTLTIDFMTRNRNLRPDINLLIASSASPEAILSSRLPQGHELGSGLQELLKISESQLGIYTPTTMEEFTYRLSTPGVEPAVPQIKLIEAETPAEASSKDGDKKAEQTNNKTRIALDGMAVFKGNRRVGALDETESRGYHWLRAKQKQGGYFTITSPFNPDETIGFEVREFSSNSRARIVDDQPRVQVDLTAYLFFYEQTGPSPILNIEYMEQLESQAAAEIERQAASCIRKAQELNSDILGWGRMIYQHQPDEWERIEPDWNIIFPGIQPDIQVVVKIRGSGLSRESFPIK